MVYRYTFFMRFVVGAMVGGLVVSVGALSGGCDPDCNTLEPAYGGSASDEGWRVIVDARGLAVEGGDASSPVFPAAGTEIRRNDGPQALRWESPLQSAALLPPPAPFMRNRRSEAGLFDMVSQMVFPSAHAHLPPITSDVHFVEIDIPGRACPVSALTSEQSFLFDEATWDEVIDNPGERTLRILSAFLTENRITEGPFLAAPIAFNVIE